MTRNKIVATKQTNQERNSKSAHTKYRAQNLDHETIGIEAGNQSMNDKTGDNLIINTIMMTENDMNGNIKDPSPFEKKSHGFKQN